jgi:hypothetical protein
MIIFFPYTSYSNEDWWEKVEEGACLLSVSQGPGSFHLKALFFTQFSESFPPIISKERATE